ncbi:hypothetical protein B0H67DRAFT_645704 [Lasiosphaeris hirsuta]|uniref:Uncharacterized protein n=1 Tax=Lasiosphaeris hirsuta TaxID=260670 RepID=A0AA40DTS9_9PEZI|nr:hypothetical protein B0H67DRAFT_645704 [Lasiosphaeris hirsuta]
MKTQSQLPRVKPDLVAGKFTWATKLDDALVTTMNKFYLHNWPNEATLDSTWLCDIKPTDKKTDSSIAIRFTVVYNGDMKAFSDLIEGFSVGPSDLSEETKRLQELADKLKRRSRPEPSTLFLHESLVDQ